MSVRRRGDRWIAVIEAGIGPDGRRQRVQETFDLKKDAQLWEARMRQQAVQGVIVTAEKATLSAYLERWAATVGPQRKPSTALFYAKTIKHAAPIGNVTLARLRPMHIEHLMATLREGPLSPRTQQHVHRVLNTALSQAVSWRLIGGNPVAGTKAPRAQSPEMRYLTPDQAKRLLAVCDDGSVYTGVVVTALLTGMRQGEVLGLRWKDVEDNHLMVTQTVTWILGSGFVVGEPKTKAGKRRVSFGAAVAAVLQARRAQQRINRVRLGPDYGTGDWVFATPLGTPLQPNAVRKALRRLLARAELDQVRFHDLRHTAATFMLEGGLRMEELSAQLGHANVSTTMNIYAHLLPSRKDEAAKAMERVLG